MAQDPTLLAREVGSTVNTLELVDRTRSRESKPSEKNRYLEPIASTSRDSATIDTSGTPC